MSEPSNESGDRDRKPTKYKVGRVIAEYELDGLDDELKSRWTGPKDERTSLRDLADIFNKRLLRKVLIDNGLNPIQSEIEGKYEALTGESSAGVKTDVTAELERNGVDVDGLQSKFVTHQAIHTYLTEYHEAKLDKPDESERVENAIATIQRLQSRAYAVTDNTVSNLRSTDKLSTGDLEVFVEINVMCTECGQRYDVGQLLSEGKCDCVDRTT